MAVCNLTGQRFGRLVVVKRAQSSKSGQSRWECKCDCGKTSVAFGDNLKRGHTQSCGCIHRELFTTHGASESRLYTIWCLMKRRCFTKTARDYSRYGGRGITVCKEWAEDFTAFYEWAVNNGYRPDLSLDRRDNDGSYTPDNCRWATAKEQQNNTRLNRMISYRGKTLTLSQWSDELGISYTVLASRIKRGWSVERAFTQPVEARKG